MHFTDQENEVLNSEIKVFLISKIVIVLSIIMTNRIVSFNLLFCRFML